MDPDNDKIGVNWVSMAPRRSGCPKYRGVNKATISSTNFLWEGVRNFFNGRKIS